MRHCGLGRGDRIAVLAYNSIEYVISVFAAASLGSIVVALNGWWVEDEIDYALRDSSSRMLIVDGRLVPRVQNRIGTSASASSSAAAAPSPPAYARAR